MLHFINFENRCWWCGEIADSAEHIHKKTDLEREFGRRKAFSKNDPVRFIDDSTIIPIAKSKSRTVKFKKNLCIHCNSTQSQPFDIAYDVFTQYYKENEEKIYTTQLVNFEDVYGDSWIDQILNLQKYYVKNFCCRLYEENVSICSDLIDFLNGTSELKSLQMNMYLRSDIHQFLSLLKIDHHDGFLHISDITGEKSISQNAFYYLTASMSYRSLTIGYFYSNERDPPINNFKPTPSLSLKIWDNPAFKNKT